jgi:hypothetical protein
VAPQQIIKKIKARGFTYLTYKTVKFLQYCRHWAEFGVLFGLVYKLSVKIGETIAKRKTSLDLTLKVTIAKR